MHALVLRNCAQDRAVSFKLRMTSTLLIACYIMCVVSVVGCSISSPQINFNLDRQARMRHSNRSICHEDEFDSCPPGMLCKDGYCQCGWHPHRAISCNGTSFSSVLYCYCVTLDEETNATLIGNCVYNCGHLHKDSVLYSPLPQSMHKLNKTCDPLNRTGALCGRCKSGHYPLAYSFNWTCIKCPHARTNWVRYIAAAYLPLTVFCILILFFKVKITSSHFYPVVWFSQIVSSPVTARAWTVASVPNRSHLSNTAVKVLLSIYGIWNLDFFRPFYSDLCLGINILPTLALDYAIAVYPLLLMAVTYLLIVLYDKNFKIVTILWRPLRRVSSLFGRNWNIRTSIINAFGTFLFLSNVKFLSVSFDLLVPTQVYQLHPTYHNVTTKLYYAPDVDYFGKEHLPYAILAIICLSIFSIFPVLLLILYPCSCFQKLLNCLPVRSFVIHTLMDSFQGRYKDGTEPGTRDWRWMSSIYFIMGFSLYVAYAFNLNILFFNFSSIILILLAFIFVAAQPYKPSVRHYNTVNVFFSLMGALAMICFSSLIVSAYYSFLALFFYGGLFLCLSPFIYTVLFVLYKVFPRRRHILQLLSKLKAWKGCYVRLLESGEEEQVCDRINNPAAYPSKNLASFPSPEVHN